MNPLAAKTRAAPAELVQHRLYVLDQDLEKRAADAPDYFWDALHIFRKNVGDRAYPCYFARRAFEQGELFVSYADWAEPAAFAATLAAFLDYVRPAPERRQVLAAFAEPGGERTHDQYARRFWDMLHWLHDHDSEPWPADVPPDPHHPAWEFSFHGTAMFVFAAAPTHRLRQSRNLGDCLVLLFQPRNVFRGIEGGTRAGRVARQRIRDSLMAWDGVPAHPSMGDYGDPSNFEWRQYFVPDDQSDMYQTCPLKAPGHTADISRPDEIRTTRKGAAPMIKLITASREFGQEDDLSSLSELFERDIDANKIIRAFASNEAFRAAERHELSTAKDPFRRPVRPDDLEWLDYSKPLDVSNSLKLSALLGHRMLRNIYDSDLLYLAPTANAAAAADMETFYSSRNRLYSALAAPILERHLFTLLADVREPIQHAGMDGLIRHVSDYHQQHAAHPGHAFDVAVSTRHREEAATFVILQLSAYAPAGNLAIASGLRGDYQQAHPGLRDVLLDEYAAWTKASPWYQGLLNAAQVSATPAAYWQLYLSSSLARGNHLHFLARNRELLFHFLGALLHKKIDDEVTRARFTAVAEEGLGLACGSGKSAPTLDESALADLVTQVAGPFVDAFGRPSRKRSTPASPMQPGSPSYGTGTCPSSSPGLTTFPDTRTRPRRSTVISPTSTSTSTSTRSSSHARRHQPRMSTMIIAW